MTRIQVSVYSVIAKSKKEQLSTPLVIIIKGMTFIINI